MLHRVSSRDAAGASEGKLERCDTGDPADLSLFLEFGTDDAAGRAETFDDPGTTTTDF